MANRTTADPEGDNKKVLFVCAAGRLRSATAMHLMNRMYGWNTRCCGVDRNALVPITGALVLWADEIVCMNHEEEEDVQEVLDMHCPYKDFKVLDIPDEYEYMDDELCALIQRRYFR